MFFCEKYIVRHVMEAHESWTPCFLCRSLLLSTAVLNDEGIFNSVCFSVCVYVTCRLLSFWNAYIIGYQSQTKMMMMMMMMITGQMLQNHILKNG